MALEVEQDSVPEQYTEIGSKLSSEPVPRTPPHILK